MKTPKTILSLTVVLGMFLIISSTAWAASTPAIFYSDLTAGPNTGGQNNNGVFVTIWGNNFGSSQGTSYVTVGGGQVSSYLTWTNTMICFQLGSSAASGNIVLVTSSGNATGPAFTVQTGNIYFVQPGASSNGTGTFASPFNHLWYFESIANPGDTVYVMAGTINNEEDGHAGYHSIVCPERLGTQGSPISWIAYPNATVTLTFNGSTAIWTNGASGGSDQIEYAFRGDPGSSDWQTFSKFTIVQSGGYSAIDSTNTNGWKVVGNNITASSYVYAIVGLAGNYSSVLGNEIHNSGTAESTTQNQNHSIYWDGAGSNVDIGWNYLHNNTNAGFEVSAYHQGLRIGKIHDNLMVAANPGDVRGINIGGIDPGETASTVYGNNIQIFNNIIVNCGQDTGGNDGTVLITAGTTYVYNNTIYGTGTVTKGMFQFPLMGYGPNGGNQVVYFADNILYNTVTSNLYLSDGAGNAPTWSIFPVLAKNNYYGEGNGPTQDTTAINANPQFVTNGTNFQLQASSPDINAGYNTTSIVAADLSGLLRGSAPTIGAYEYAGSSVLPSLPVAAITSPSNASSFAEGSNISITANASETNGSISNVKFYNGTTLLATDTTSPYSYTWMNVSAGNYTLTAVATDANGVSTTSNPVTVTVDPSVLPSLPVVTITGPASGSTYTAGSNVTITSTASETNGTINNIALYNGSGVLLGSSSSSPFNFVYTNILAGNYTFYAIATDVNSVSTTSSIISITVTAPTPAVSITSPSNAGSFTAGSSITITASASESNGSISNVSFYNGTSLLGTSPTSPYSFIWANVSAGSYSLTAVATDANGISATSSPVAITVATAAPAIAITSPSNGSNFTTGSNITINASVSGSMRKVMFYNSSTMLGSVSRSPYSYTWKNMAAGTYSLTAQAVNKSNVATTSAPVTITVTDPTAAPSISIQPVSVAVTAPATATFSMVAAGNPAPTYQWLQSVNGGAFTNISGATSASYTTPATTTANSGNQFECVATNTSGFVTSNAVSLIVNPTPVLPSISSQPVSATVTAGSTATFSVAASGVPAPTYQWMQSVNGGTFVNISGATAASYTTPATTTANNGNQFECVVSNASGSVTSNVASLTVNSDPVAPSINTQPVSLTVTAPSTATFSVVASGVPAPTYQWMQSVNGGTFTNISGATSASYTTPATTTANSGNQFECVVSNASGFVISNTANLTVDPTPVGPSITSQPVNVTVTAPSTATFSVAASGIPAPTYQWKQSINGGSFVNISGATSASYTTPATTTANSGNQFECVATNASGSVTSDTVVLTVDPAPVAPSISTQPVGVTVTAPATATFTVAANGVPAVTYQWMQSVNGGAFTNIGGATSPSYTTPATTTADSGNQYECVVSNASGSATSNAVSLTVDPTPVLPSISLQPVSVTVTAPSTATFSVAASGVPAPTYQWKQSINGGAFVNISGATAAFYTTPATTTANTGNQFECVVSNASGSVTSDVVSLTVNAGPTAPSITSQPVSVTVTAPATASFSVVANGVPAPTYQWLQSINGGAFTNISGATAASYTTPATTTADSGTKFECVVTNASGSVTSNTVNLTVNPTPLAPSIASQPLSMTVTAPSTATFSVTASGVPAVTYQWLQSVNGGAFTNISGATSASYTTPATTTANNGNQFECVVSNASGSVTSNAANLTVNPTPVAPIITTQPVSVTVTAPSTAIFTVAATGTPAPNYQWMQSVNGGAFTNIAGATAASYTTPATTTANSGNQFECVVSNASGSLTSNAANLTVNLAQVAPIIISQPASETVSMGSTATFTVAATGTPAPNYQWFQANPFTNQFLPISGATSSFYTTSGVTLLNTATQFECVVSNAAGSVTSNAAGLTVSFMPVALNIISQPVSATVTSGTTVTFTVAAMGTPTPNYQWMQSVNGGTFVNISGATNSSYTTMATMANSGTRYACVVSNPSGSLTSNAAILTVNVPPVPVSITAQPVSVTVTTPSTATFSVTASGTPAPTYQWMQSVNGGSFTNISGATSASYTTAATTAANNGTKFECVVTNIAGSVTSSAAILTVNSNPVAPSINAQPVSQTVTAPLTATFSVTASGTPAPTYQWMQSVNGGSFTNISGATSASYTTPATTTADSGNQYECVVTNASGSVTSNAANLTVNPTPVAPIITTQPVSVTVTAPSTAIFTVAATGTPAPNYQWMQSVNGGAFVNISRATTASYTTGATIASNSGIQYECVVSNAGGSITSNTAVLTIDPTPAAPSIASQPINVTVVAAATASFSVSASGVPAPTYQWMESVNGGSFVNIPGAVSASYTTAATVLSDNGTQFQCIVTNTLGSVTSNAATLTVNAQPMVAIIAQPADTTVLAGGTATFTVAAAGSGLTYQWMQKSLGAPAFMPINGANSPAYVVSTSIINTGNQYECVVSNASGAIISDPALLTVNPSFLFR